MKQKTHKNCKNPNCKKEFKLFRTTDKYCCKKCQIEFEGVKEFKPSKPIAKVSDKRKIENLKYSVLRVEFLGRKENSICFIDGCENKATTIEHRCGRVGTNFLDTKTWAGCCLMHNLELENNPELSKEYQLSKIHGGKRQ